MIEGELLLQAVRDTLRSNLTNVTTSSVATSTVNKKSIQITPDEKVPPIAGEEFIGLYHSEFRNLHPAQSNSAKESYNLSVGITRRMSGQPIDRVGDTIYTQDTDVINRLKPSMLQRARDIIDLIDGVFAIITTTNGNIASGTCTFITPLGLISGDAQPKYVDEDHFWTDPDSSNAPKGLFMEIVFGGAELVRVK